MEFEIFFKSDLGKVRETNEDTVVVDAEKKIFAICDGFGESSFGKIASSMSSETLLRYFGNGARNKRPAIDPALNYDAIDLVTAIHLANLRLYNFVDKYIDMQKAQIF